MFRSNTSWLPGSTVSNQRGAVMSSSGGIAPLSIRSRELRTLLRP